MSICLIHILWWGEGEEPQGLPDSRATSHLHPTRRLDTTNGSWLIVTVMP